MEESHTLVILKKRRASTPKTRSGCLICKIRRVKCDEGKPQCLRCLQYCGFCEGYFRKPQQTSLPPGSKILLPRLQPLCHTPSAKLFSNDKEYGYFERFRSITVGQLTGFRGSELWSRVVLQATETEPSIRHAATAVGALDFKALPGKLDEAERARRQFAYFEYQKAIVGLRKLLAAKNCDIRTKLISCVLFACFEAYHGNSETTMSQLFAGVEMMEEYLKQRRQPKKTICEAELPAIDQELVQSFTIIEIQACAWGDRRSADVHVERMKLCAADIENMPTEFKSCKEAGFYLSKNTMRGIHLRFSQTKRRDIPASIHVPRFVSLDPCCPIDTLSELGGILATFQKWSEAFAPLFWKAKSPSGKHLLGNVTLLRMHYVGSVLWIAAGTPGSYRRYTKELREIVNLSKQLISILALGPFSLSPLELVIVLPLAIVGWNYKHRALRREVIAIFATIVRREATWDSSMLRKTVEWMAEIEEEGLSDDEEYVPEDVIATITNLKIDNERRSVAVSCLQGIKDKPGETVSKSALLYF